LHGYGATHREWLDFGHVDATLDRLIAAGEIRPVVAVMPDAAKSWYVDSGARGGPGDYATAIALDVPAHIERAYGAAADSRAVAGLSMGGFGALVLGFTWPDRFTTAAALSPAVFRPGGVSWAHWSLGDTAAERARWFPAVFGDPFSVETYRREQPFALIPDLAARRATPRIWLASGDDDHFGFHLGTAEMFLALRGRGIPAELRLTDGGHDWTYWRRVLPDLLRFIDAGWPTHPD
jgi:enterochelin esterase family protein